MELLRKLAIEILFGFFVLLTANAQDFSKKRDSFQKSYAQESKKEYAGAIENILEVYDEKSYEINLRLGWLHYLLANHTESVKYYSKAVKLMPYAIEARLGLANPLTALGNTGEATKHYEKILEITPNYSIVLYRLGLIYYNKGDFEAAFKYFNKVVNLWPFDYDGLTMLGWTYYRLNNMREARVLFEKALLSLPDGVSAKEGLSLMK